MLSRITVRTDTVGLKRSFQHMRDQQIPFATAKALTDTAREADEAVTRELPQRFTIRNQHLARGIRYRGASKTRLTATVFSVDPFMVIHETGGEKRSIQGRVFDYGKFLAIPVDARRNKRDIVDKRDWPENLIEPFVLKAKDGRRYLAVRSITIAKRAQSVRTARGKQRRKSGLRLMYLLVDRVRITARFGFNETVKRTVSRRFEPNFRSALNLAMSTAR
jgi:hypothetical protein